MNQCKIAEYKFDKSIYENLIPEFNPEFTNYEIVDEYLDTEDIVTRSIEIIMIMDYDAEPDEYGVLTTEYGVENVSTFSAENIVTRTIYSNELPTLLRFGNSDTSGETGDSNKYNSLLEVLYLASSEITYAGLMFHRCANVSYICPFILTNKNNSLHGIFSGCHALTSIDVSNFDTSNVTDMSYAFYTNNLIELDLSDWDTSNITNMNHILYSCKNLKTLNISNWNLNNVDNIGWFANQCDNLNEIIMNDSDYNSVNKIISELPITTNGNKCNFYIGGVDDISKVNIREEWDIMNQYKIAQYTTNASGVRPRFDLNYVYTANEVNNGDGTYTVTLTADNDFTYVDFNDRTSLLSVEYLKVTNKVTSTAEMFYNCDSLTSVNASDWDTSNVTEMWEMFRYCCSLEEIIGIENWNTSSLTDLTYTFYCCCTNLKSLNLSSWDTSKVTLTDATFSDCTYLEELDISNWDLSNADPYWLSEMFYISELDPDNEDWYDPDFKPYLKTIRCNNANTISLIAPYLPDRSTCEEAGIIITDNVSEVNAEELADLNWQVAEDLKVAGLIVQYKFNKSTTANLLPVFDSEFEYTIEDSVDGTTVTRKIFSDYIPTRISFQAKKALLQVEYINSSRLNTAYGMFYQCTNLTYVNMPFVTYVSTMEGMFNGCTKLQRIEGIEQWNTARNSNWGSTFGNCKSLTNLDPRNFILTDAHAMGATFRGCTAAPVENFDFKNWRTPNVQYLSGTFDSVTTIKELDLSTFDVSNVGDIQGFLGNCSGLERVDLSNWILTEKHYNWQGDSDKWNPLKMTNFFKNCSSLVDVKLLNTNRFTAYKICEQLPSRTADKPSVIHITMEESLDNELAELITSKGWTIDYEQRSSEYIITSYYFNPEIGNIMPVFNEGFEYTYEDSIGLNNNILRTIKSSSLPTNMYFGTNHVPQDDADSLTNVLEINTSNIEDLSYMFKGCRNIGLIPIGLVTSKATRLTSMFEGCSSLDINYMYQWYTENVTDMSYMFKDCICMTSIGIEELKISEGANIEGMFEGCVSLRTVRATPAVFDAIASVLPDRPFDEPGQLTIREGTDNSGSIEDITCDDELLKHNWLTDRNRHLDLFVMMGQSNMQGQSEMYKEFEVPMYQSCTYLYNKDELAQVKHPFGENIQTLGTIEELGYYQLEGAVGCDTGLPYGSLSPHFAASYFEQTHTPTLMVQCARGATTMKDWLPGTTQQRFEIAVEKTQKSIAAVEEIGRTIRGKYLVWLQGESDGAGTGVGTKKTTYKTRFLQFWNAIKAELGFEKCFIIRVHKFRDGYKYNCFPIIEAQEELALENDDIEMVTRVTGYLQYYDENPEHYTIQHAYQGLQIVSNHDHYTWEGYKLVGDTAGSRVGQYINTGIMPELEAEPWPENVTASSEQIIARYKFDNTITSDYRPAFNDEFTDYRVFDATEGSVTNRRIISKSLPSSMKFNNENNTSLLEVHKLTTDNLINMQDLFYKCSNLTYINLDGCKTDNVTTLERAFNSCTKLTTINGLNNLNTSNVNNIGGIFSDCSSITNIDVKDWNVSQITNFGAAFRRCPLLTSIDLSNWNTENAEIMSGVFTGCKGLTSIDVSNFKTNKVTTINQMFHDCTNLASIKLFNLIGDGVNTLYLFGNCKSLNEVVMRNSDHNSINKVIEALPTKSQNLYGELDILYASNLPQINISTAKSKYWNLYVSYTYEIKVAQCNSIMIGNKKIRNPYITGKKKI